MGGEVSGGPWGLGVFLDALSAATPAPAGGSAAAGAGAFGAALCEMIAGISSSQLDDAAELASRARTARARLLALAEEDAVAFEELLSARRAARRGLAEESGEIAAATERVIEVPFEMATAAVTTAALAAELVERARPALRGDAYAAVLLAESAGHIACGLVRLNLGPTSNDRRAGETDRMEAELVEIRTRADRALSV